MAITCVSEVITPDVAAKYDALNKNVRNVIPSVVDRFARDMTSGRWRETHQGIAFDEDGFLVDGQHRIRAVIKSGVTVKMMVFRGITSEQNLAVDCGTKRADGVRVGLLRPDCENPSVVAGVANALLRGMGRKILALRTTPDERAAYAVKNYDNIQRMISVLSRLRPKRADVVAAFVAALREFPIDEVSDAGRRLADDELSGRQDPLAVLKRAIVQSKDRGSTDRSVELYALTVSALRLALTGRPAPKNGMRPATRDFGSPDHEVSP